MRRNYTKIIGVGGLYRILTSLPTGLEKSGPMSYIEAKETARKINKVARRAWKEHDARKPRRPFQSRKEE